MFLNCIIFYIEICVGSWSLSGNRYLQFILFTIFVDFAFCRSCEGLFRNLVNYTILVTEFTWTDQPKSVCYRCAIKRFHNVCVL